MAPSANQAVAKPGAASTVCVRTSAAAAKSPRAASSTAALYRRSLTRSPEDTNNGPVSVMQRSWNVAPGSMMKLSAIRPASSRVDSLVAVRAGAAKCKESYCAFVVAHDKALFLDGPTGREAAGSYFSAPCDDLSDCQNGFI